MFCRLQKKCTDPAVELIGKTVWIPTGQRGCPCMSSRRQVQREEQGIPGRKRGLGCLQCLLWPWSPNPVFTQFSAGYAYIVFSYTLHTCDHKAVGLLNKASFSLSNLGGPMHACAWTIPRAPTFADWLADTRKVLLAKNSYITLWLLDCSFPFYKQSFLLAIVFLHAGKNLAFGVTNHSECRLNRMTFLRIVNFNICGKDEECCIEYL